MSVTPRPVGAEPPVDILSGTMVTVGVLARMYGLARSTLLYYDAIGLLRPASRSAAGYRRYGEEEELRLAQICRYRRAGLSLDAIAAVLDGPATGLAPVLEERLGELDEEIAALREQQRLIATLLQRPAAFQDGCVIDKQTWVELLSASGMSEDDMRGWHEAFERTAPSKHQRFLTLLGLSPEEVAAIRTASATGDWG